jgi:hypothetical protein
MVHIYNTDIEIRNSIDYKRALQIEVPSLFLFLNKPVFHVLGFALALEVELDIVESITNLLEGCFRIEVGIAIGEEFADITQAPPIALL